MPNIDIGRPDPISLQNSGKGRGQKMGSIIDADDEAVARIGDALINVSDEMKEILQKIHKDIENASDNMRDESGQRSCEAVVDSIQTIRKNLENIARYGDKYKNQLAPMLRQAHEFRIKL